MVLSHVQFQSLAAGLAQPGEQGFSVNIVTGKKPRTGYMVGEADTEGEIEVGSGRAIAGFARQHKPALGQESGHLGGWKPEGASTAFLDVARKMPSTTKRNPDAMTSAMDVALMNRQEAIYDVRKKRSIMSPDWKHFPRER